MQDSDIEFYLTGGNYDGDVQSEPTLSLGNYRGSFISDATIRNIFDHVYSSESLSGDTEYRCICVRNSSVADDLQLTKVWIESNTTSVDTEIEVGIEAPLSQPDGRCQSITNESTAPIGITFSSACVDYSTGLSIGDLDAGQIYYIWVKRKVKVGASPDYDNFEIKVQGSGGTDIRYRERKHSTIYDPDFTFSNQGTSEFRMFSSYTSIGQGYCIINFNRSDIDGKRLRITWDGSYEHQSVVTDGRAYTFVEIYDGTLDATNDDDWPEPEGDFKGQGLISTVIEKTTSGTGNPNSFSESDATYDISLGEGDYSTCTLMVRLHDAWEAAQIIVDIDKIEILDTDDSILFSYDFPSSDTVTAQRSGTTADYGYCALAGTYSNSSSGIYCITDVNTPSSRAVFQNGIVKIRSRIEDDVADPGSIDVWIREEIWDGSDTSQGWDYMGRIKYITNKFDHVCPWSRIYISEIDLNKTVVRFFFTDDAYMDLTLYRSSQGIKMEWCSGITGYMYFNIDDSRKCRFAYGEGADLVDAEVETTEGWNNLGTTNNWIATFDDDNDYFIGLALTDDAVAPRCYVDVSNDNISYLSLGTSSDMNMPHYWFYNRRVVTSYYTYEDATYAGGTTVGRDKNAVNDRAIKTVDQESTDHHESGSGGWQLTSGGYTRVGTKVTYSNTDISRVGFRLEKYDGGGATSGDVYFRIRRTSDDAVLGEVYWGDASTLPNDANLDGLEYQWCEASFSSPVTVDEEVRILVEFSGSGSVWVNRDTAGTWSDHQGTWYWSSYTDVSWDIKARIYYSAGWAEWNVWNICNPSEYRLIARNRPDTGSYSFNDSAGTGTVGRTTETYTSDDYWWDYILYVPIKCRSNIGISGPEDVVEELLCEWDYGIYINNDYEYDVKPSYTIQSNDWNITPTNIICLPSDVDKLSTGSVSFYRSVQRDFGNASREQDTDGTPATPGNWTTTTTKIDAINNSCYEATVASPGTISWSVAIPDDYYWAFIRLHAETDNTISYQIKSDDVGTTYYDLDEDYYRVADRSDQTPSDQTWTYFEGYVRVEPDTTNTITLNGTGATGSQRYVIDYFDIIPVKSAPFVSSLSNDSSVVVKMNGQLNNNIWRSMFNVRNVIGRGRFVSVDVMDQLKGNQYEFIQPVAENLSSAPTSGGLTFPFTFTATFGSGAEGRIYYNTTDNKFYGHNGSTWVEL